MIRPLRLRSGDRVALVAPASPFAHDELVRGAAELMAIGFEPVYDDRLLARSGYVAGTADHRVQLLHEAWRDPSVRGVIAVRGGFGSAHLLPLLDPALMRTARKVFVGYSDLTVLLWYHLLHGIACFHGPMVERRLAHGEAGYDRMSFVGAVGHASPLERLDAPGLEVLWPGEASGLLVGGTITQLLSLAETPWSFQPPHGCVLFLEDAGERPYRVDRMLTQMRQMRLLERAAAIVFGAFPKCDEPGGTTRGLDVLRAATRDLGIPVIFGFPSGHTDGPTWTLPFGVNARVVANTTASLEILEAAVE